MSDAPLTGLEASALVRRFDDGQKTIEVLAGLDLSVGEGESVAIVGESGVGKSTLLHLLGALDHPDSGSVRIGEDDLFSLTPRELAKVRNRKVGFVFQFHHLLGDFDAVENVMMPLLVSGASRSQARARASKVLERVGLADRLTHRPGELSGGEQQRVAVARSIVAEPNVLLADEPTGNLDPTTAHEVQQLLQEIQREAGCSLIIATHSATLAAAMDRDADIGGRSVAFWRLHLMRLVWATILVAFLVAVSSVAGIGAAEIVSEVRVEGNRRVDTSSIRVHVELQRGDTIDRIAIDEDIKSIYEMGFFDNIYVTTDEVADGVILTYLVEERPYVTDVVFKGVKHVQEEDLEAVINVTPRTIFDPRRVATGLEAARKLYTSEGYPDAKLDFEVEVDAENNAVLVYTAEEGELIRVGEIDFEGAAAFSDRELRKLMTTRTEWMFSFLTGAGLLNEDELATDVERVTAYYYDNGYLQARVDEPQVERDGDALRVRIKVDEGPLFRVGEITFSGDVLMPEEELLDRLLLRKGDVFRASELRESIFSLTEAYGNLGYAFADVVPDTRAVPSRNEMDVRFSFASGDIVTIRRIEVRGNTKTRDEVVRRELALDEGERFSGSGLQGSKSGVRRLGFFDEVELSTERTESADEVDLVVDVKEGRTGAFSAGAGFSSADSFLFNARISENNLFGRGQRLVLNADFGSVRQNFRLAFTEPWFMDIPLSLGVDLFSWQLDFDRFNRGGTGFALRASYPLRRLGIASFAGLSLRRVRAGLEYKLEQSRIDGVDPRAPADVWDQQGTQLTSSVIPSIFRNTLDHPFDPSSGSRQSFTAEIAGLGGETDFFKVDISGRWFYPLGEILEDRPLIYSFGATLGWGLGQEGESGEELPVFERYFPGGINSVRGFDVRELGPTQQVCNPQGTVDKPPSNDDDCTDEEIGGSSQLVINNEFIIGVLPEVGVKAVLFFDIGNAFLNEDAFKISELRYAAGWGVRWLSPFGPLRIEVGYPLDPEENEDSPVILFSFGAPL